MEGNMVIFYCVYLIEELSNLSYVYQQVDNYEVYIFLLMFRVYISILFLYFSI